MLLVRHPNRLVEGAALVGAGAIVGVAAAVLRARSRPRDPVVTHVTWSRDESSLLRERLAETHRRGRSREQVPDELIAERVRRQLGRPYLRHPGLIDVHVYAGRVLLTGAVLRAEVDDMVERLFQVRGVRGFDSHLHVFDSSEELGVVPSA